MPCETEIENWGNHSIVWVQSEDVQAAIDILRNEEADGLGLSPYKGFALEDISFLTDVPNLKGVVLPFAGKYDLKILGNLPSLSFLTVAENNQPFDYGTLLELEELRIEWHSNLMLPKSCSKLRSLYVRGYKPKSRRLVELPPYENVNELEINQGNLVNLEGIERLPKIANASFFHLRQLQSIIALVDSNMDRLHIEGCKKISDIERLSSCRELKSFRLIDCGKLKSLAFLAEFGKLEEFRFVNTIVEDGDMTPLLQLKSVGFLKKANYSHTPEEIREAISSFGHNRHHISP